MCDIFQNWKRALGEVGFKAQVANDIISNEFKGTGGYLKIFSS